MRNATPLLAVSVLALAACSENGAKGVCKPFAQAPAAAVPGAVDGAAPVDACLHRWAYTLAASEEDDAVEVADAVLAACAAPLARWNQQAMGAAAMAGAPAGDAPSLITGEPSNPIAERGRFAEGRALFYVVQARAGNCRPPADKRTAAERGSPDV